MINGQARSMMKFSEIIKQIFNHAICAVDPAFLMRGYSEQIRSYISERGFKQLLVIGFGKASYYMARTVCEEFDEKMIAGGAVITKYGHTGHRIHTSDIRAQNTDLKGIRVFEAGHPVPDKNGMEATGEVIKLLKNNNDKTLVLCLISGGGSALLVAPYQGISLNDKQIITELLLQAGADITELNTVRKHISQVKGGRLAQIAFPSEVISLMISDVIGDRLDVIASGPTAPDSSSFKDAIEVIDKYGIISKVPGNVMSILSKGRDGLIPETPAVDDMVFRNIQNIIVGSNKKAIEAAQSKAGELGIETDVLSSEITGEARDVGKWLAGKAKEVKAENRDGVRCLISGGETTVKVKGKGKGGRNTELALSFALEIEGTKGITMLSAGTDGTDGPTDAAGAIVDGQTIMKARNFGLNPDECLDNNDSYNFFKAIDSLLITGPTGTNVMDMQIILIG